jgi:AraC-like DNA-binding protein
VRRSEGVQLRGISGVAGAAVGRATYVGVLAQPEMFDEYILNFADEGRCEVVVRGTSVRLAREDLQWRLPGELRIVRRGDSQVIKRRSVLIPRATLEPVLVEMGRLPSALAVARAEPFREARVHASLDALFAAVDADSSELAQHSAFYDLVGALGAVIGSATSEPARCWPEPARVRAAKEYVDDCYAAHTSLDALAAYVGLNKFHLLRAFKRAIGMPPHRYRTYVRIARSRERLRAGRPIADVALEVGFGTQARFHAAFRAVTGMAPGYYCRQVVSRSPR